QVQRKPGDRGPAPPGGSSQPARRLCAAGQPPAFPYLPDRAGPLAREARAHRGRDRWPPLLPHPAGSPLVRHAPPRERVPVAQAAPGRPSSQVGRRARGRSVPAHPGRRPHPTARAGGVGGGVLAVACQEAGVPERAGQAVSPSTATSRRHHLLLIIRNAGWLAGGRLTGDVLNLLLFIMLSRRFGPAGVGQYAYAFSIVGIAYAIASLGLEEYGVREMARRGSAEGRPLLEGLVATQLSVVAVAVAGMAGYLAVSGATAEVATIVALLAGYQLAAALARTLFVPASAEQEMGVPAVTELLSRGAAFLTALLLLVVLRFP